MPGLCFAKGVEMTDTDVSIDAATNHPVTV